jgi:hypothetical protein
MDPVSTPATSCGWDASASVKTRTTNRGRRAKPAQVAMHLALPRATREGHASPDMPAAQRIR